MRPTVDEFDARYFFMVMAASALVIGTFVAWHFADPIHQGLYLDEDGPVENATAIGYGLSSIIFTVLAWRARAIPAHSLRLGRFFLLMWALAAFIVLGEEISWGQRIFGYQTPEWLAAYTDYQNEFNLHNLEFVRENFTTGRTSITKYANLFSIIMMTIGVALPVLALTPIGRSLMQRFAFPVSPAAYMVIFVGGLLYGKYLRTTAAEFNFPIEVREWIWSMGFLMFAVHGLVRPFDLYRLPRSGQGTRRTGRADDSAVDDATPTGLMKE